MLRSVFVQTILFEAHLCRGVQFSSAVHVFGWTRKRSGQHIKFYVLLYPVYTQYIIRQGYVGAGKQDIYQSRRFIVAGYIL